MTAKELIQRRIEKQEAKYTEAIDKQTTELGKLHTRMQYEPMLAELQHILDLMNGMGIE